MQRKATIFRNLVLSLFNVLIVELLDFAAL
jgi:hypothetical protein